MVEIDSDERRTAVNPKLRDISLQIEELSIPVNKFWVKRGEFKPRKKLTPAEDAQLQELLYPKNQKIIDFLVERNANGPRPKNQIVLYKDVRIPEAVEYTHPFSINRVALFTPSNKGPTTRFITRFMLTSLRRENLVSDSEQAEDLLGERIEEPESVEDFIYRTSRELEEITRQRKKSATAGIDGDVGDQPDYPFDYLDQLSTNIIVDRLIALKCTNSLPKGESEDKDFKVLVDLYKNRQTGKPEFELVKLALPNKYNVVIALSGQRIGNRAREKFNFEYDEVKVLT